MSIARAIRYRRLALAQEDKASADLLLKLADECDRGFSAPPNGVRRGHPAKMSRRQKQETPNSGLSGTHSMTNVEKPIPAHKVLPCQMRSIGILAVQTTPRRRSAPRWAICSKMPPAATAVTLCGRSLRS